MIMSNPLVEHLTQGLAICAEGFLFELARRVASDKPGNLMTGHYPHARSYEHP